MYTAVLLSATLFASAEDPTTDYLALMDASLSYLEAGLPL